MGVRQGAVEDLEVNREFWNGRRVFLTGHTGFKGAWAAAWLARLGAEVTGFAHAPETDPNLWSLLGLKGVRSVIGDLNSRRGQIQGQDMRGNANVINAMVPLMNMFGYVNNLRSMSQGRATFTMQFDHYAEAPANVSAEVQKKFA